MRTFAFAVLVGLATAATVNAAPILDFNMDALHPATAVILYTGTGVVGDAPLQGGNISVDEVTGIGTPANNGDVINIVGGRLDFQTGNLVATSPTQWVFGPGGFILVRGNVDLDGDAVLDFATPQNLLAGVFFSTRVFDLGVAGIKVDVGVHVDVLHSALAAHFGVVPSPALGTINLSFIAAGTPPGGFTSSFVGSGDIITTSSPAVVPEPATMLLVGSGLVAIGALRRRRAA